MNQMQTNFEVSEDDSDADSLHSDPGFMEKKRALLEEFKHRLWPGKLN